MIRRFGVLFFVLSVILGANQTVSAQAQSARNYIQPQASAATTHAGCNASSNCQSSGSLRWGGGMRSFLDRSRLDYQRNVAWPHPFVHADRASYKGFIQPCIDRGWEIQNTLSEDCFDGQSGRLNRLGAAKIRNVVHAAPLHRRSVFVYGANGSDLVQARIKEVQSYLTYEFGRSNNVTVLATANYPHGGRGIYAEHMIPKYFEAIPNPALNAQSVSSAVSGGGGG